jgi:hypothetical protein
MANPQFQLQNYKRHYKKISLILRKTLKTKEACEDAGYLMYYPNLLSTIEDCKDSHRILRRKIRYLSRVIKHPELVEYEDERI